MPTEDVEETPELLVVEDDKFGFNAGSPLKEPALSEALRVSDALRMSVEWSDGVTKATCGRGESRI